MNPAEMEFEVEVARQLLKSHTPGWLKLLLVLEAMAAIGLWGLAIWMETQPDQWADFLIDHGIRHPKPFAYTFLVIEVAVCWLACRRWLVETDTNLKWWVKVFYWRCCQTRRESGRHAPTPDDAEKPNQTTERQL
jgi:hypothetical protein